MGEDKGRFEELMLFSLPTAANLKDRELIEEIKKRADDARTV
jgi:hypothetical protein